MVIVSFALSLPHMVFIGVYAAKLSEEVIDEKKLFLEEIFSRFVNENKNNRKLIAQILLGPHFDNISFNTFDNFSLDHRFLNTIVSTSVSYFFVLIQFEVIG
ncbi:hypothetical protein PVAND_013226 [Polypedilum vanderplanki]|uniref:Gustatory receptor n=1 Tax=Polypedilum vanderplanki TaxID=319348 RepID=A0A9J6CQV6_POLVA|nr:hypothetical protein PVAND_013226 [Polypedilum vanderplanki]